jgi:hypothetical protein
LLFVFLMIAILTGVRWNLNVDLFAFLLLAWNSWSSCFWFLRTGTKLCITMPISNCCFLIKIYVLISTYIH